MDPYVNQLQLLLEQFPNKDWDYGELSNNPNMTWDIVKKYPNKDWYWFYLCDLEISEQLLWDNPNFTWNWNTLSNNPSVTWEIVKMFPNKDWDWEKLIKRWNIKYVIIPDDESKLYEEDEFKSIHMTVLIEEINIYVLLSVSFLSFYPNANWKIIGDHPDKAWQWGGLCANSNPFLDFDIIYHNLDKHRWWRVSSHPTVTIKIVLKYPTIPWDWGKLSSHPNITWIIVLSHIDLPWNWLRLPDNPNITWDIILDNLNNPDMPWVWWKLSTHPDVNWNIIKSNLNLQWDWMLLSSHPNIDFDIVLDNLNFNWNWIRLSSHPNVTLDVVLNNINLPWDWEKLTIHPNIDLDMILDHIDLPWNWHGLSEKFISQWSFGTGQYKPLLNDEHILISAIVKKYPDKNWKWYSLSKNIHIDLDLIKLYPNKDWDWKSLSINVYFDFDIVILYPNKDWDWNYLSSHIKTTWTIVCYFPDKPWNWRKLSIHPNMTWDIIKSNLNSPWAYNTKTIKSWCPLMPDIRDDYTCYDCISSNPNINLTIVINNPDITWNWKALSANKFEKCEHIIQQIYIKNIYDILITSLCNDTAMIIINYI